MLRFLFRRFLLIIPTLILLSILAFFLSKLAPGDPVADRIEGTDSRQAFRDQSELKRLAYIREARELGLHLPEFYISIRRTSIPDTINRILPLAERKACLSLTRKYGNWALLQEFRDHISRIERLALQLSDPKHTHDLLSTCSFIRRSSSVEQIAGYLDELDAIPSIDDRLDQALLQATSIFDRFVQSGKNVQSYLPGFAWHGIDNQYHRWAGKILKGDFGISAVDGRPVGTKITEALRWTLLINIPVIFIAFLIAIPLGVESARCKSSTMDKVSSNVLFGLYAMPSFWLATLFVVFLTTSEYGAWTDLFPSQGLGNYHYASGTLQRWGILAAHLFLPILSLTLGTLAYLFRQMRNSILAEMSKDYILLARAKGLNESRVTWKHAFPNALFPVITIIGGIFPAAISGSVIIEVIFNIPGMGRLLYMSILAKDWNVVFATLLLAGFLTVVGYLIADILYSVTDPRVSLYQKKRDL